MAEYRDIRYVTRNGRYKGTPFEVILIIGDEGFVIDRVTVGGFPQMKDWEGTSFRTADEAYAEACRRAEALIES